MSNEDEEKTAGNGGSDGDGPKLAKAPASEPGLSDDVLRSRIESLIFASPEPITVRRMARVLGLKGNRVRELLGDLEEHYRDRGVVIGEISGGFAFHSHPENADVIRAVFKSKPLRLSRPALETLAIIAYRQPVTRAEIEDVRRVDSGGVLRVLFEKKLIRVLGRKEEPGRPIIYGTGADFLRLFGLKSLGDLPALHEFTDLWDEHRSLVDEEDGDEPPEGDGDDATPESEEDGA